MEPEHDNDTPLHTMQMLFEQGLYRQAMEAGEAELGPYRQWKHFDCCLLGARCLGHLGLKRSAAAAFLSLSRSHPNSIEVWPYRLEALRELRGPAIAWQAYVNAPTFDQSQEASSALLKTSGAFILAEFRDYERANELMLEARSIAILPWNTIEYAYLKFLQGETDQAWELINGCLQVYPRYLPALTLSAQLHASKFDFDGAIGALVQVCAEQESVPANVMLFNYCLRAAQFELAETVLQRIRALVYEWNAESRMLVSALETDWLCAQGRYEEAVPLILTLAGQDNARLSENLPRHQNFRRSVSDARSSLLGRSELEDAVGDDEAPERYQNVLNVPLNTLSWTNANHYVWDVLATWWNKTIDIDWSELQEHSTGLTVVRSQASEQGWHVEEFEFRSGTAETLLDRECPFLIELPDVRRFQHVLVVGYDRRHKLCFLRTPNHPRLTVVSMKALLDFYAASGPRCFVLLPESERHRLEGIHFESAHLFEQLFEIKLALKSFEFKKAAERLRQLESVAGDHRLTLIGISELARAEGDDQKRLEATLALLERFPEDGRLQLELVKLMETLEEERRLEEYLTQLTDHSTPCFEVRARIATLLSQDSRQEAYVTRLYSQLLKERPLHAYTLHHYGRWLSINRNWRLAHDYLKFSTLQDEALEKYVTEYVRSAIFNKMSGQALDFVKTRYERFKHRTTAPAKTLYLTYDMLDQLESGIEVLQEAVSDNPQDIGLQQFYFDQLLLKDRIQPAQKILSQVSSQWPPALQAVSQANLAEATNQIDEALNQWRRALCHEPLHRQAHESIVRLLVGQGNLESAIDHLNSWLGHYPGTYWLLRWRVEYVDETEAEFYEGALVELLEEWPDDAWALSKLADLYIEQRRWPDAEVVLNNYQQMHPASADVAYELGRLYYQLSALDEAKRWFLEALDRSVDCVDAFEPLLSCVYSTEEKRELLGHIHGLLMERRTTGEGVLKYHKLAVRYLPAHQVRTFIGIAVSERPDIWQSWWISASHDLQDGELERAYETSVKAIRHIPLNAHLWLQRAEIERLRRADKRAMVSLRKCIALAPEWSEPAIALAQLLRQQNLGEEAKGVLQAAARRSPRDASVLSVLAELHWQNKEIKSALRVIDQAVTVDIEHALAWKRYAQWAKAVGSSDLPLRKHSRLLRQSPGREALYPLILHLSQQPDERVKVLEQGMEHVPRSLVIHQALLKELVSQQRFDDALALCSSEQWGADIPIEISSYGAWIKYRIGRKKAAVVDLDALLQHDPNYQEGWRLLAVWSGEVGAQERAVEAARQCLTLAPNDPDVLCFVAEVLQNRAEGSVEHQQEIKALLARAFYIRPFDHYNALTYIDLLLEANELHEAEEALMLLKVNVNDAFVRVRELQLACFRKDLTAALNHWDAIITDPHSTVDSMQYSFNELIQVGWFEPAIRRLLYLMQQRIANAATGAIWARYIISKHGLEGFQRRLGEMTTMGAFGDFAVGYFLTKLHQNGMSLDDAQVLEHEALLLRDARNGELMLQILYDLEQWRLCAQWAHSVARVHPLSPAVAVKAAVAAMERDDIAFAKMMIQMANRVSAPNGKVSARILSAWLDFVENGTLTELEDDLLGVVNELEPLVRLFYWYLRAARRATKPGGYVGNMASIKPLLKNAQRGFPLVCWMEVAKSAKLTTLAFLKANLGAKGIMKPVRAWALQSLF